MFNPGETIVHTFTVPFTKDKISKAVVTYKNCDDVFLEKTITSGHVNSIEKRYETDPYEAVIIVELSQEETLLFKQYSPYKIQVNIITPSKSRFASKETTAKTGPQHIREVIQDERT